MIISRSPLRISLGGGGTDLPSYYEKKGGFLISAAIDKYVYIILHKNFDGKIRLKYSDYEETGRVKDIRHAIFRATMEKLAIPDDCSLEICSMADIPAGTGLGSSSTFTTALLKALHQYKGDIVSTRSIAEEACDIEMNMLREPIGKQDQYISAYGGVTCMEFDRDGRVHVYPLELGNDTLYNLEDNLMLYFTGFSRSASSILKEQDDASKKDDSDMIRNLDFVKELGLRSKEAFEKGDLREFADIMNTHWEYKKKRSGSMSNPRIDEWYDHAMRNGALGGKMIGAGGGGFLMFYTENKSRLRAAMKTTGMDEVRFRFEMNGAEIIRGQ
ncbi:MAG: GHMP kinase [Lachnospiraceae bacterium]|nr:GHMP kinase [Lachnospiraceae bacterium]